MAEVLCPICGRPNSEHREFCDFCGNPLDGALRVEGDSSSARNDLLGDQLSDSMDDASRLDSLVPAPDDEIEPAQQDKTQRDEPLNGDSRLESLLSAQDDLVEEPPQVEPEASDAFNGGSRLDDYLPVEETPVHQEPGDIKQDDSSRLDEYFSSEESSDALPLDRGSLSEEQMDDSSRLDDYLTPESPQEEAEPDESARLDDFFADDPFKSPDPSKTDEEDSRSPGLDPFAEPPLPERETTPADQSPLEDPFFSRDDLFSDSPAKQPPEEQGLQQPDSEQEYPDDLWASDPDQASDWDLPETTPAPEDRQEEKPAEDIDPGQWDFLESAQPSGEEEPPESIDAGEWDFLDPAPTQKDPEQEKSPESIDAGEWDFLDPTPVPDQSSAESPAEPAGADEWDLLDPSPARSDQEEISPSPEKAEPEEAEDWSFLDPGPTSDLEPIEIEQEYQMESDEEDAGWLDMLQDPATRQRSETEPEPSSEPQQPQTDWLEKIKRLNKSSDLVDEDSSFPDWLSVTGKTAEFSGDPTGEGTDSPDDVPDWLHLDDDESLNEFLRRKDLSNEEYKPKITTDSLDEKEDSVDSSVPDVELSDSQQIKFPSWAEEQRAKEQKRQEAEPAVTGEVSAKEPIEPFQIEEEHFDDLFSEELPSWLTEASSEEIRETISDNLAQGELPGWVEAMRPVVESTDASGLDEDEEYIENYGPLAGIPSVLPAEAEIGIDLDQNVQKPLDLLATKSQQRYVDLLKRLIGDENKSKTIQLPSPLQTQRVLRWLMSIVMLVAIAATLIFSGSVDMESPPAAQVEGTGFSALYEEIETLYDGQPVLIAFDYQPASAGELHTAAASVVDHLMTEGTFLTFISTQPTGPALAEHFLDTTQSRHAYIHTQKYINLGYLPGESAGLLSFMIAPEKIIPLAFDGSNAWDSPPLISIDSINDFKMILVITDDPNTAKIWIEQVGSRLDDTPLTMVVSAQVEPLIKPYFRTSPRQLNGYVAGVIDGINYEELTERPFLANKLWLPFNVGIVLSVAIIFIGGMANGVLSLFSRRKEKAMGDAK